MVNSISNIIEFKVRQIIKNAHINNNKFIHMKVSKDVIDYIINNDITLPNNIGSITT